MSQAMDEYVYEINARQLEARGEIANYIQDLERQLSTLKPGLQHHDNGNPGTTTKSRHYDGTEDTRIKSRRRKSPTQSPTYSHLVHCSSDSSLSCGNPDSVNSLDNLGFAHAPSDIEVSDSSTTGRPKARRRTLPLTPSDIEALSDDGMGMGNNKTSSFDRNTRNRLPRRRRIQDSGLGESLLGFETRTKSHCAYPWRKNSHESKLKSQSSLPVKYDGGKAGDDSDSFRTITPISAETGSPISSVTDSDGPGQSVKRRDNSHHKNEHGTVSHYSNMSGLFHAGSFAASNLIP